MLATGCDLSICEKHNNVINSLTVSINSQSTFDPIRVQNDFLMRRTVQKQFYCFFDRITGFMIAITSPTCEQSVYPYSKNIVENRFPFGLICPRKISLYCSYALFFARNETFLSSASFGKYAFSLSRFIASNSSFSL